VTDIQRKKKERAMRPPDSQQQTHKERERQGVRERETWQRNMGKEGQEKKKHPNRHFVHSAKSSEESNEGGEGHTSANENNTSNNTNKRERESGKCNT
jgi:hypothetical protein